MNPLVTVVVPTYNGQEFVAQTIDSILAQSYRPFEVVVCDDGSSDATLAILAGYGERIRIVEQRNQGVAAARNRAVAEGRGELVAFLDHDDLWEPTLLETLVPRFAAQPELGLVYSDSWIIDQGGTIRGRRGTWLDYAEGDVFAPLLRGNFIPVETTLMRTQLYRDVGGSDPRLRYLEDYELCLRVARRTKVGFHPGPLARYRVHQRNLSHDLEVMLVEWLAVLGRVRASLGAAATPYERRILDEEEARLRADLAWRSLRRGDVGAAATWMQRGGNRAGAAQRLRIGLLSGALQHLSPAGQRRLLDRLPRRKLYGVGAAPAGERAA